MFFYCKSGNDGACRKDSGCNYRRIGGVGSAGLVVFCLCAAADPDIVGVNIRSVVCRVSSAEIEGDPLDVRECVAARLEILGYGLCFGLIVNSEDELVIRDVENDLNIVPLAVVERIVADLVVAAALDSYNTALSRASDNAVDLQLVGGVKESDEERACYLRADTRGIDELSGGDGVFKIETAIMSFAPFPVPTDASLVM